MNPYIRELEKEKVESYYNPDKQELVGREKRRERRKLERKLNKK